VTFVLLAEINSINAKPEREPHVGRGCVRGVRVTKKKKGGTEVA